MLLQRGPHLAGGEQSWCKIVEQRPSSMFSTWMSISCGGRMNILEDSYRFGGQRVHDAPKVDQVYSLLALQKGLEIPACRDETTQFTISYHHYSLYYYIRLYPTATPPSWSFRKMNMQSRELTVHHVVY